MFIDLHMLNYSLFLEWSQCDPIFFNVLFNQVCKYIFEFWISIFI
jgi:hypothetical protein